MAASQLLSGNPLLKLSIPMIVGIVASWCFELGTAEQLSLAAVSLFTLFFGLSRNAPKWLFGVGAVLFMFSAGVFVEHKQSEIMAPQWESGTRSYEAHLLEVPQHKGTSTKVLANVISIDSAQNPGVRRTGLAYLYLPRSVEADAIEVGDILHFNSEVRPPVNAGNPAEFDVRGYYYIKGITGSAYLWGNNWERLRKGEKSLSMFALSLREKVVEKYRKLGFDGDALSLLSALTVGEKRDFSRELKESYAVAGASHVLALSGLHLGIIYLLLSVLYPFHGRDRWKLLLRESVIVTVLWMFAYVAGLSASVVRSATLFTLMSVGRSLRQDVSPLSSLAFASIAMLLFSPHSLFDVGFQLSFSAVLAILLLAPHLQSLLRVDENGRVYRYVANLLILSLAAQLGTLPFIWYHFGVLPLYSLLTNIFVVPLAFVLIALALLLLFISFIYPLRLLFAAALQFVVDLINNGVSLISSLPGASLALPPITVWGAVCVALFILLFSYALANRRKMLLLLAAGCLIVFCVVNASVNADKELCNGVIVYNNNKNPLLHMVGSDGENWLLSTVPQLDAEYEYASSPFIKREGLGEPVWIDGDYKCSEIVYRDGVMKYGGLKIKLLADDLWRNNVLTEPVDVLVLCRGFLGPVKELVEVYPSACILLDGSLYKRSRDRIVRECMALQLELVDISATGAVKIVPHDDFFEIMPLRGK